MTARKEFTKKEIREAASAYKKGETLRPLAAKLGVSVTTMRSLLIAAGVTMRARGKVAAAPVKKVAKSTKAKTEVPGKGKTKKPVAKKGKANASTVAKARKKATKK